MRRDRTGMACVELQPERYTAYLALRRRMLAECPWAFLSSVGDDAAETESALASKLDPDGNVIYVVEVGNELVASAGVVRVPRVKARHRAFIWGVYCAPEHRGRGHGRTAVGACVERCRAWAGVEIVTLSATVHPAEPAAIRLYESMGFEVWGAEPDAIRVEGVSYDEAHLALRL